MQSHQNPQAHGGYEPGMQGYGQQTGYGGPQPQGPYVGPSASSNQPYTAYGQGQQAQPMYGQPPNGCGQFSGLQSTYSQAPNPQNFFMHGQGQPSQLNPQFQNNMNQQSHGNMIQHSNYSQQPSFDHQRQNIPFGKVQNSQKAQFEEYMCQLERMKNLPGQTSEMKNMLQISIDQLKFDIQDTESTNQNHQTQRSTDFHLSSTTGIQFPQPQADMTQPPEHLKGVITNQTSNERNTQHQFRPLTEQAQNRGGTFTFSDKGNMFAGSNTFTGGNPRPNYDQWRAPPNQPLASSGQCMPMNQAQNQLQADQRFPQIQHHELDNERPKLNEFGTHH